MREYNAESPKQDSRRFAYLGILFIYEYIHLYCRSLKSGKVASARKKLKRERRGGIGWGGGGIFRTMLSCCRLQNEKGFAELGTRFIICVNVRAKNDL